MTAAKNPATKKVAEVVAPSDKKHIGNLRIESKADAKRYADVTEVTGYLDISADASLPVLTTVGGSLYISADASLPVLTTVGSYLDISADASLPVLTTVGGYLDISADASLPVLTTVGSYLDISDENIELPALEIAHGVKGRLLAIHKHGLWLSDDYKYYAGCKGPMTKNKAIALSKVYEDQETAQIFIKAILADEESRAESVIES